jgi:hypothetical protein
VRPWPNIASTRLAGGNIAGPSTELECASDDEAIEQAKALLHGLDIEVWSGSLVVIRRKSSDVR